MAVRRIQQPFRYSSTLLPQAKVNLFDNTGAGTGWSTGAALVDNFPSLQEQPTGGWSLIGVAVNAQLALADTGVAFGGSKSFFGKFGVLRAGIIIPSPGITGTASQPASFDPTRVALPQDSSLIDSLWDPAVDSLPPVFNPSGAPATTLPVTTTILLPTPIDFSQYVDASTVGAIGLWLAPSLIGPDYGVQGPGIYVTQGQYSFYYSDKL